MKGLMYQWMEKVLYEYVIFCFKIKREMNTTNLRKTLNGKSEEIQQEVYVITKS
uniref:Uncharacterized protein n=1 Tax=Octopus bimaculoides TaxID=37653 RepID=A0A0L8I719_OCTBM